MRDSDHDRAIDIIQHATSEPLLADSLTLHPTSSTKVPHLSINSSRCSHAGTPDSPACLAITVSCRDVARIAGGSMHTEGYVLQLDTTAAVVPYYTPRPSGCVSVLQHDRILYRELSQHNNAILRLLRLLVAAIRSYVSCHRVTGSAVGSQDAIQLSQNAPVGLRAATHRVIPAWDS
jgi:hypothetical protein